MSYKTVAIKAAREAGKILKIEFRSNFNVKVKAKHDVVTDVDKKSEKKIIGVIKSAFPEHSIYAEESGLQDRRSNYCWIIDPIDGTANFVIGNPFFSISIALTFRNEVILGVVFNPILNELYYAEKRKGAYLNGKRIKVSNRISLKDSFLVTGYLWDESSIEEDLIGVKKLLMNTRKAVVLSSPALNLCNVARGRIDGLVDNHTTPEDHAAGSVILTEAGGKVQNYKSNSWDFRKVGVIASNNILHETIVKLIRD